MNDVQMKALLKSLGGDKAYIKVNLPPDIAEFRSGNGEGIWAVPVDKAALELARSDTSSGEQFEVYAANDSMYYPDIAYGTRVLCVTRGGNRPVAVWDALNGTKEAAANKHELLKKLGAREG